MNGCAGPDSFPSTAWPSFPFASTTVCGLWPPKELCIEGTKHLIISPQHQAEHLRKYTQAPPAQLGAPLKNVSRGTRESTAGEVLALYRPTWFF